MEPIGRALIVYFFLFVLLRLSGKRTLSDTSVFEFVVLLIISETTQQAMVNGDESITNAFLLITTLVGISVLLSYLKVRYPGFEEWLDGIPLVLMASGKPLEGRMKKARVDLEDIQEALRTTKGDIHVANIKWAILERDGEISVIVDDPSRGRET
jgi:uncharacterized membrane protein YcaP (DUF421 family)